VGRKTTNQSYDAKTQNYFASFHFRSTGLLFWSYREFCKGKPFGIVGANTIEWCIKLFVKSDVINLFDWRNVFLVHSSERCELSKHLLVTFCHNVFWLHWLSTDLLGFWFYFFSLFFVSGPCTRLSWPSRQHTLIYRMLSCRIVNAVNVNINLQ